MPTPFSGWKAVSGTPVGEVCSGSPGSLARDMLTQDARTEPPLAALHSPRCPLSLIAPTHHTCLASFRESCLTNPLREICTVGSVRGGVGNGPHLLGRSRRSQIGPTSVTRSVLLRDCPEGEFILLSFSIATRVIDLGLLQLPAFQILPPMR
jgi:hypothetical protein